MGADVMHRGWRPENGAKNTPPAWARAQAVRGWRGNGVREVPRGKERAATAPRIKMFERAT